MSAKNWSALLERAKTLMSNDKLEDASALLQEGLAFGGPSPLWRLLALSLRRRGLLKEAYALQCQIVEAGPGDLDARFDLAETLLLLGDFDRGWREYRFRYRLTHTKQYERKVQEPRWDGRAMPGGTLLIHDEQGYGDTLQFLRFLPQAQKQSGARIVLEIVPELLPLARRMNGYDQIIVRGELPPPFDMHCELMGLPLSLSLRMSSLPGPMPYITANLARLEIWHQRLRDVPRPWVALAWAGRPNHSNDRNRSLCLSDLAPLARQDISFLALQKGPAAAQANAPPNGMSVLALDREIMDFEDSAAILMLADLLITVDSSPAHLAGALGRPAWVLLPFVPDWRWLTDRTDSPWYPSLRLFRQPTRGDWNSTLIQMAKALNDWRTTRC